MVDKQYSIWGDEYYTLPYHAKVLADNINLDKDSVVWCPFDTDESEIVKALAERFTVINTHISTGDDFFKTDAPMGCRGIISNPPFTLKKEILERIKDMGIPFALYLPFLWLNDGIPLDYGNQLILFRKRVHFIRPDFGEMNKPRTNCFVLSNGLLKNDLTIIRSRDGKNSN